MIELVVFFGPLLLILIYMIGSEVTNDGRQTHLDRRHNALRKQQEKQPMSTKNTQPMTTTIKISQSDPGSPTGFRSVYPMFAEGFLRSDYVEWGDVPSQIIPGKTIYKEIYFECPACGATTEQIPEHGELIVCGCGLHMQTFGNSLKVWRKGIKGMFGKASKR